jgi:hypothetical protein
MYTNELCCAHVSLYTVENMTDARTCGVDSEVAMTMDVQLMHVAHVNSRQNKRILGPYAVELSRTISEARKQHERLASER